MEKKIDVSFWKGQNVAVTGARGFIGHHMVNRLLEEGANVTAIVSNTINPKKVLSKTVPMKRLRIIQSDLTNISSSINVFKNQYAVFHFAGLDGGYEFKRDHELDILETNVHIAQTVLEASRKSGVSRLMLMSSIKVYPLKRSGNINEHYGRTNWFYESLPAYAWSKRIMEIMAKYYNSETLHISIARAGNVYGPGDNPAKGRVIPRFIKSALSDQDIVITDSRSQKIPFIHVKDLVARLMRLVEVYPICDPVNIVGSESISLYDLARLIIRLTGSKSHIICGKDSDVYKEYNITSDKHKKLLGMDNFRSLEQGIKEMLANNTIS